MMLDTRLKKYQEGNLEVVDRAGGRQVWVFRWREEGRDGKRIQRKKVIGDLKRFPTKSAVRPLLDNLRAEINSTERESAGLIFKELWAHFQVFELRDPEVDRSPTTISLYLENFQRYILPPWGQTPLPQMKPVVIEKWLRSLRYAPSTKAKLRNQMSAAFSHAIRHELWSGANPIASVRQSAQRLADPAVLSISEIQGLLQNLDSDLHRTLVLIAAVTGLRRSELRGLQWKDIDFINLWITPRIGIVRSMRTKLKTRASRRGIPMPLGLADVMLHWRNVSVYNQADDWVFASESTGGVSPVWLDVIFARYIKPAARKAGIHKKIGWHTFRHSLASLLAHKGEDVKVVQELLRHANASTTMELYHQADTTAKRIAQSHTDNLFNLPRTSTTRTSEGIYPNNSARSTIQLNEA